MGDEVYCVEAERGLKKKLGKDRTGLFLGENDTWGSLNLLFYCKDDVA